MNRPLKVAFGLNAASLSHLLRLKPMQFARASVRSFEAAIGVQEIPEIGLSEILGDRKPCIKLTVMRYEDGMLPSDQAMALLAILVAEQPLSVLEIGTFMGHTTRQMAENLEHSEIHTVDLPPNFSSTAQPPGAIPKDDFHLIEKRVVGREYKDRPCSARITQHFADTASWDFQGIGIPAFFFIDGSHTYEYCKNDSDKCFELAKGKGVFLWHDCDSRHPGVVKCISEWRLKGRDVRRIYGTPLAYWKGE